MKISKWKKVSSKLGYSNPRIKIRTDTFTLPNGNKINYCILERGIVVAILPITSNDEVVVVEQYRPAINDITIDIPGGGVKVWENESPLVAAKRELKEETGYSAKRIYQLGGAIYPDSGRSEQKRFIYVAEELSPGKKDLEETEFIKIKKIPLKTLFEGIMKGKYKENILCLSIMMYYSKKFSPNKKP